MIRVAINGFGRIGRITLRVILAKYLTKVKPVAINTSGSMSIEGWAHLFKYDSVYGKFKGKLLIEPSRNNEEIGVLVVNNQKIPVLAQKEPLKIPWKKYKIEVVIEATGVFRERKLVASHLEAGAKKVVVSSPAKGVDTFVIGVNEDKYKNDLMVSNASCTTNCVALITKIIKEKFGLQKGLMTTIHAYTADQRVVDDSHKDLRRARAAGVNIIPTSSGATASVTKVLPGLRGLFGGLAFRVPVICGSVADFNFLTTKKTTVEEINQVFRKAAQGQLKGIIEVTNEPLVSCDILGSCASAVVDLSLTQVIDGDLVKIIAWYDNEWAYCCRLVEMAIKINE